MADILRSRLDNFSPPHIDHIVGKKAILTSWFDGDRTKALQAEGPSALAVPSVFKISS